MIDLEQLRKDVGAIVIVLRKRVSCGRDYHPSRKDKLKAADTIEQLEREYIALREAADALATVLDAAIKEHDTADYGHDEENPWTMREWFDASDRAALTAYRKATK